MARDDQNRTIVFRVGAEYFTIKLIPYFGGPYRSQTCLVGFADQFLIARTTVRDGGNDLT